MRFGSVCSGIEAASCAWEALGWQAAWFSEIATFPSKLLAHRFPKVPNHGSLIGLADRLAGNDRRIDLLVGGTPCQPFSVAGLRRGQSDKRNLTFEFARLAAALRPRWVLWENVPGVLSSDDGRAFGSLVGGLVELGYGLAWRVLDAQYFRVAQRRERVFVVGSLGGAAASGSVLFEPEGVRRDPPAREGPAEEVASTPGARSSRGHTIDGNYVPEISGTLRTQGANADDPWNGRALVVNARQDPVTSEERCGALDQFGNTHAICVTGAVTHALRAVGADASEDGTGRGTPIVTTQTRVRRLTPRECERLQGFPDDWTLIPTTKSGKLAKDAPRYAALGNSMAVPVMRWIGQRIARIDALRGAA